MEFKAAAATVKVVTFCLTFKSTATTPRPSGCARRRKTCPRPRSLIFCSQSFAPFESAWLVVSSAFLPGDKRGREDEQPEEGGPQWYQQSDEEKKAGREVGADMGV